MVKIFTIDFIVHLQIMNPLAQTEVMSHQKAKRVLLQMVKDQISILYWFISYDNANIIDNFELLKISCQLNNHLLGN